MNTELWDFGSDRQGIEGSRTETTIVERTIAQLAIKLHIEKFDSAREGLWISEHVSAEGSRAVWRIRVDAKGDEKGMVFAFIYLDLVGPMRDNRESLEAKYRVYLPGESWSGFNILSKGTYEFKPPKEWHPLGRGYCVTLYITRDDLNKSLNADGSLLVRADVECPIPDDSELFGKWQDSISKLHESEAHSDCTLMVGGEQLKAHPSILSAISIVKLRESDCTLMVGEEIVEVGGEQLKAHRCILSAISPTFKEMFGNEAYREAKDGVVTIKDPPEMLQDYSAKPYNALLSYAYSGCVNWTIYGDCKRDVLVLACKYLVIDLKDHVEKLLICEITTGSLADLVLLADSYSCDQLKRACLKHLSFTSRAVVLTPQWEALTRTRGDLTTELLRLVQEERDR